MVDLYFKIDQDDLRPEGHKLTGGDIETIERFQEGEQVASYRIKKLAAKFMVTEDGQEIPYLRAISIFDAMETSEYADALIKFIQAVSEAAIPKARGTQSSLPSEAGTNTASQAGSLPSKQPRTGESPLGMSVENPLQYQPGDGSSGNSEEVSIPKR